MKVSPMLIRVMNAVNKGHGVFDLSQFLQDTTIIEKDGNIVWERKQEAGGRTFVVSSVFDGHGSKTAQDKLVSLVEMQAGKSS